MSLSLLYPQISAGYDRVMDEEGEGKETCKQGVLVRKEKDGTHETYNGRLSFL